MRRAAAYARRQLRIEQLAWLGRAWKFIAVAVIVAVVTGAISVVVLPVWLYPYVVGAEAASLLWWLHFTMIQTSGLMGKVSGITAEYWTIGELGTLRSKGWRLINHVMLEHVDVDHVLIGPGGLFAIETKYRSSWTHAQREFGKFALSARTASRDPRLRPHPRSASAVPLVVMWCPHLRRDFDHPVEIDGVTICPSHRLIEHLLSLPTKMPAAAVEEVFTNLDRYVRSRDAGEARVSGPIPRWMSDVVNDIVITTIAVIIAAFMILLSAKLHPAGVWSVAASILLGVGSLTVRARTKKSARFQSVTAGISARTIGATAILLAVIIWNRF